MSRVSDYVLISWAPPPATEESVSSSTSNNKNNSSYVAYLKACDASHDDSLDDADPLYVIFGWSNRDNRGTDGTDGTDEEEEEEPRWILPVPITRIGNCRLCTLSGSVNVDVVRMNVSEDADEGIVASETLIPDRDFARVPSSDLYPSGALFLRRATRPTGPSSK